MTKAQLVCHCQYFDHLFRPNQREEYCKLCAGAGAGSPDQAPQLQPGAGLSTADAVH
jgi:hypothetical protein